MGEPSRAPPSAWSEGYGDAERARGRPDRTAEPAGPPRRVGLPAQWSGGGGEAEREQPELSGPALSGQPELSEQPELSGPALSGQPELSGPALSERPERAGRPAPSGQARQQPAEPSWAVVLATTLRLWLERRGLRRPAGPETARRLALRTVGLLGLVLAVFAAGALTVGLVWHTTAGSTSGNAARPGSRGLSAAAAARGDAAGWVVQQVSKGAIVACDPVMCSALEARGFPAGSLLVLGSSAADPLGSAVVVATAAVRSLFGGRLTSEYAPIAIASFGSGTARIDVLVTAADGAAAYQSALRADLSARQATGAQLLSNPRIVCSPAARAALAAGQVDARLLITLAALADQYQVHVLAFGGAGPGASPGVPTRTAVLASPVAGSGYLPLVMAFLRAQRAPYLASSITTARLASGRAVLHVGYSAPGPLGLLGSQAATASVNKKDKRHQKHSRPGK